MKTILSAFGAALALCATATPVVAQSGNSSDVSGASVTTSSIVGGVFAPGAAGGAAARTSPAVQGAVTSSAFGAFNALRGGTISGGGISVSGGAVQAVGAVMNSNNPPQAVLSQVTWALAGSGAPPAVVNALTNSLQGMLVSPSATGVANAISSFNGLVNSAKGSFLSDPPPEFQAIYAVLSQIVAAGNAATR
jgi:hypothetical protein